MEQWLTMLFFDSIFSVLALIFGLVFLDVLLIVQDFYSGLKCFVQPLLRFPNSARWAFIDFCSYCRTTIIAPQVRIFPDQESRVEGIPDEKSAEEVRLSGLDVKQVMQRLGISINPDDFDEDQIVGVFDEREPSLEEVKEAFDVFDRNSDGFIDSRELLSFLQSFGFRQVSEEQCREMVRAFDENGDSVIDFREFTKLVEISLL